MYMGAWGLIETIGHKTEIALMGSPSRFEPISAINIR
jgi:hypothetical protein